MSQLAVGDNAPAFSLPDAQDKLVSLSDFAGRKVVLYFYPAAMTPGCTTQAVDFTAARDDRLEKFRERKHLNIQLLADPSLEVIKAYGAWGSKTLYGKTMDGVLRSTFVIDVAEDGTGTIELAQYNVRATGHVDRLRRDLGLLHL